MALANFFDKAALGAAQVLKGFDRKGFEQILGKNKIGIVFDNVAVRSHEGKVTLDLIVRLTARFYPDLQIIDISNENGEYQKKLELCALSINPAINLSKSELTSINIVVGDTRYIDNGGNFYIGSDGWIAKLSTNKPVGCGDSQNPFGAGAAACFGAANVFRLVFKDQLVKGDCDMDFSLSMFDFTKNNGIVKNNGPNIDNVYLDETHLVGIGAIGNAVIWTLANIPNLTGKLEIIDHQEIELSNLQRYCLANQYDINKKLKVTLAKEFMSKSKLKINVNPVTWEKYVQKKKNWFIKRMAICVDSAKDRIIVQGSLPNKIFNAWTQPASLGVSRHLDFVNDACLTCLYIPDMKRKSLSEVISESLGLKDHEPLIRKYLATKTPVDDMILSLISTARKISYDQLIGFQGKQLEIFYSEVVCGGILMRLSLNSQEHDQVEVPSAFESALAGILLAAELIIDAGNLRPKKIPALSKFNLLRPLSNHITEEQQKHHSSRCICQDPVYIKAYENKWLEGKFTI